MARRRSRKRSRFNPLPALGVIASLWLILAFGRLVNTEPFFASLLVVGLVGIAGIGGSAFIWLRWRRREHIMARVRTLNDLLLLSPTQFEYAVMELLRAWGYRDVRHTGGGGDLAADLTCRTVDGRSLVVVQCKRYAPGRTVGSPEVQKFIGMLTVHHRAHEGIFVTTSTYTQPALALAHQHNLRMVDGAQLATAIQRAQQRSA